MGAVKTVKLTASFSPAGQAVLVALLSVFLFWVSSQDQATPLKPRQGAPKVHGVVELL